MNIVERAIDDGGGLGPVSKALGVTYQAVQRWARDCWVPAERVLALEKISGVSRSELRPDLYPVDSVLKTKRKCG